MAKIDYSGYPGTYEIEGSLEETYCLCLPSTILHVDELIGEKVRRNRVCDLSSEASVKVYVADGMMYSLDNGRVPTLRITRGEHNPVFKHMNYVPRWEGSFAQLTLRGNYAVSAYDFKKSKRANDTTVVDLTKLSLEQTTEQYGRLEVDLKHLNEHNLEEQKLISRVLGVDQNYYDFMKSTLFGYNTVVYLLHPEYVRKCAKGQVIARVGVLEEHRYWPAKSTREIQEHKFDAAVNRFNDTDYLYAQPTPSAKEQYLAGGGAPGMF